MTQDEFIEITKRSGLNMLLEVGGMDKCLEHFAKLVAAKKQAECEKAIEQSRAYQLVWYPEGYSINPNKIDSFYEFQWKRSMEAIRSRGKT